jgi:copper homeostasis protein
MRYRLEILAYHLDACRVAEEAGADRIEFCDNPAEGGTTPSFGSIRLAIRSAGIPVFPMIRPRGGDFLYSDTEFEAMKEDVLACKSVGAAGIVLGLLKADGSVDADRTAALVDLAYPMDVTFHRAFDQARNPLEALEAIIQCGCTRLLTSGQQATATDGIALIKVLVEKSANRIQIMPGSGLRAHNLAGIADQTQAFEFHSSASSLKESAMLFRHPNQTDSSTTVYPDPEEISVMKRILQTRQ